MKLLLTVVLVLTVGAGIAQAPQQPRHADIERHVQSIGMAAPDTLAQLLTAPFATEGAKVRAIFRWITENIAYNVINYPRGVRTKGSAAAAAPFDSIVESKSLNERVAYSVLQKKAALCNGYARLFKTLCDYAGIRSEIVTGYARSNMGSARFRSNHTWNAVYIDSTWHLLDATWAAGFISYGQEFIKHYNDYYFLTPPEQLIRTHYPEDLRWTLLAHPPTLAEYRKAPFRPTAFVKYTIQAYRPASGIVEASIGDTLVFELESRDVAKDLNVAADSHDDDSTLAEDFRNAVYLQPVSPVLSAKTAYTYVVTSPAIGYLHLLYNNDVVLRYRLKVKEKKEDLVYNLR